MPRRVARLALVLLSIGLLAAACTFESSESAGLAETSGSVESPSVGPVEAARPDPFEVYNPVYEEDVPRGFRQLLARDDIFPVYDPTFVSADAVDWPEDGLVVGVDLEGEARAYPVGFMNRREMVIDNHRGIPTLVTW